MGTVVGYVYTANGKIPLAGVSVYVKSQTSIATKSDKAGYFELEKVPVGTQTIVLKSGSFKNEIEVDVKGGKNEISTKNNPIKLGTGEGAVKIKMAVIYGSYDRIQDILNTLGFKQLSSPDVDSSGYVLYDDPYDLFYNLTLMSKYAIIFVNCGADETLDSTMIRNIKQYIHGGKSMYVSDWAYGFVERPFLEYIDFYGDDTVDDDARAGLAELVSATVLAQDLVEQLRKNTMQINFDLGSWVIMDVSAVILRQ
ncbi:MAG: carboxypeptidase-like regulatory domain-containing protein [candidate division WOR-3 bacterium]|nr:carboxypeptidase-like regulatory domain-containing protein [candidate division WOR-3 bacterium]